MAASYPSSIKTFTTKTNKVDLVDAAHINDLQNEVTAIETELGTAVKGTVADLKARLAVCLANNGAIINSPSFPASPTGNQIFVKNNALYLRDLANTAWGVVGSPFSDVVLCYVGKDDAVNTAGVADSHGKYNSGTSTNPTGSTFNDYFVSYSQNTYYDIFVSRFTKLSGINTITIHARMWGSDGSTVTLKIDIGGVNNTVTTTSTSPVWVTTATIDISSLTTGVVYTITASLKNGNAGARAGAYVSGVILAGSL